MTGRIDLNQPLLLGGAYSRLLFDKQVREAAMDPNPKILVIYFTRSGTTEQLAQALASAPGAQCEHIRERDDRSRRIGTFGLAKAICPFSPVLSPCS